MSHPRIVVKANGQTVLDISPRLLLLLLAYSSGSGGVPADDAALTLEVVAAGGPVGSWDAGTMRDPWGDDDARHGQPVAYKGHEHPGGRL